MTDKETEFPFVSKEKGDFAFPRPKREPTSWIGKKLLSAYDGAATFIEEQVKLWRLPMA